MFTWKPIYQELAQTLLGYKNRQPELVQILEVISKIEIDEKKLPVIRLIDAPQPANGPLLSVIDPFTFFAVFNRNIKNQNRIEILKILKDKFHLKSEIPSDFTGIPLVDNMQSWFFPYQDNRKPDDIESLWQLAQFVIEQKPEELSAELFNRCLEIHTVGLPKLTMGMFWLNPDNFLALDGKNATYIKKTGVTTEVSDYATYLQLLHQTKGKFHGLSWPQLSHDAYFAVPIGVDPPIGERHYWLYAPGQNAVYWDECQAKGIMIIGYDELSDFRKFKSQEEIQDALKNLWQSQEKPSNHSLAIWQFVQGLKPGDVVIPKRGRSEYLGYGIVEGDYDWDESRPEFKSFRRVKWMKTGVWSADFKIVLKTLTDITKYPDYVKRLRETIGISFEGESKIKSDAKSITLPPSLNTILYGPPGTGKTYRLRNHYMKMFTEKQAVLSAEEQAAGLVKDLAWWEVIALALLDTKENKATVAQILVHPLVNARLKLSANKNPRAMLWASLQSHTKKDCPNVNYTTRIDPLLFSKDESSIWSIDQNLAKNEIPELHELLKVFRNPPSEMPEVTRYRFTTFHQSFSYEDFVEGIKPQTEDCDDGQLRYEVRAGIFKEICREAEANPTKDYALFIDEINRGNVASIFGELITLLEEDKRLGEKNELKAILPYSREEFGVPKNLYVIGTMNTADRSVEALDTALRRRFTFEEMRPDPDLIPESPSLNVDLRQLLNVINARLEQLLDDDHCIGHSYFMGVKNLADLRSAFANKIIPLLREYFYGNPAKIGMVLGEGFVISKTAKTAFAAGSWGTDELDEKEVFIFTDANKLTEQDFQAIYAEAHPGI